jgi:hypothetical protein
VRRLLAHVGRAILQCLEQRFEDVGIAQLHKGVQGGLAYVLVGVFERGRQRRDHLGIGLALHVLRVDRRGHGGLD